MVQISKIAVIKSYFGMTAAVAMKELKPLSEAEKLDLARGAAKEMKLTQDQVNFPLTEEKKHG